MKLWDIMSWTTWFAVVQPSHLFQWPPASALLPLASPAPPPHLLARRASLSLTNLTPPTHHQQTPSLVPQRCLPPTWSAQKMSRQISWVHSHHPRAVIAFTNTPARHARAAHSRHPHPLPHTHHADDDARLGRAIRRSALLRRCVLHLAAHGVRRALLQRQGAARAQSEDEGALGVRSPGRPRGRGGEGGGRCEEGGRSHEPG